MRNIIEDLPPYAILTFYRDEAYSSYIACQSYDVILGMRGIDCDVAWPAAVMLGP